MSITNMIVANKTSFEICNKLGSCKHHAGDQIDQVLNTLLDGESEEDDVEFQDQNSVEDDGGVDFSQINTGGVEPDYEFHENRVGNDDSHDNDINDKFQVNYVKFVKNNGIEDELDNILQSEEDVEYEDSQTYQIEGQLCKVCKVVVTSVLTKTTAKSSKVYIIKSLFSTKQ